MIALERLRLANEAAVKANIETFVRRFEASAERQNRLAD